MHASADITDKGKTNPLVGNYAFNPAVADCENALNYSRYKLRQQRNKEHGCSIGRPTGHQWVHLIVGYVVLEIVSNIPGDCLIVRHSGCHLVA